MQKSKNAFTMVELVFVIVVLGILAAVAIPRLAATRTDAHIAKARADIASIRSGIITERQTRLIQGVSNFIPNGSSTYLATNGTTYNQMDNGGLFGGILTYPIPNSTTQIEGKWNSGVTGGTGVYYFELDHTQFQFIYDDTIGRFDCNGTTNPSKYPCSTLVD